MPDMDFERLKAWHKVSILLARHSKGKPKMVRTQVTDFEAFINGMQGFTGYPRWIILLILEIEGVL